MYIIWYLMIWLTNWLTKPILLWTGWDWLAVAIVLCSIYYIVSEIIRFVKRGVKNVKN